MTIEGLGKKFEEARLARNLTLDEASRMTKIRPSRLAEIEADDFSQFPSLAYAKGFLLIYGKFLEVDVTPYMEAFEGSDAVTVDGYSYLQDNPAPKPVRSPVVPRRSPKISSPSGGGSGPTSLMPLVYAVVIILLGYFGTRLFLNIQRIAPRHTEPTPAALASAAPLGTPPSIIAPSATAAAVPPKPAASATATAPAATPKATATVPASTPRASATAPPATPPPTAAPTSTARPASPPPSAPPKTTATPATVPAKTTPAPASTAPAAPSTSPAAKPSVSASPAAAAEPEVRRAEPVKPEDLTKTAPAAAPGSNKVSIRPLKKTYVKVVVDDGSSTPAFERWISPTDGPVEFKGQHFSVRILDRDSVQIKKNGKSVAEGDPDVTIE